MNFDINKKKIKMNTKVNGIKIRKDKMNVLSENINNINSSKFDSSFIINIFKFIFAIVLIFLIIFFIKYIFQNILFNSKDDVVVIEEKTFLNDFNKIISNKDEYIGKDIELSGLYREYDYQGKVYKMIYRTTPGSNGNNGIASFDIEYTGEIELTNNTWIKVIGTLKNYYDESDNNEYLTIDVKSLEVLDSSNQGNAFVSK